MRVLKCDVCDQEFDFEDPLARLIVPMGFDHVFDDDLAVDICSLPCLLQATRAMMGMEDEPQFEEQMPAHDEVTADPQIGTPEGQPKPQRLRRLSPEESSEITGVRMKGV